MHAERINFLRHDVVDHLRNMPKVEDNGFLDFDGMLDKDECKLSAVLNLNTYVTHFRDPTQEELNDWYTKGSVILDDYSEIEDAAQFDKISKQYDCGFSGCFAGWYLLLARQTKFLSEEEIHEERIHDYDLDHLAAHFDISSHQASQLFNQYGAGAEGDIEKGHTDEALEARIAVLDDIIAHAKEKTNAEATI